MALFISADRPKASVPELAETPAPKLLVALEASREAVTLAKKKPFKLKLAMLFEMLTVPAPLELELLIAIPCDPLFFALTRSMTIPVVAVLDSGK